MRFRGSGGRGSLESLLFIVGHPLSHTLSPAMHNGVIARLGLPLRYIAVDIPSSALPDFLRVARAGNFLGGNVTIPHKEAAAVEADERSEEVAFCGAANVLVVRDGRLHAANTDGRGFTDALREAGWKRALRRVVLLGAGGAARGIAYEMGRTGTQELILLNRDAKRAERVAESISPRFPDLAIAAGRLTPAEMRRQFRGADLIVQCTSLGLRDEWKEFPIEGVEKGTLFADIVYKDMGTLVVRALRRRGIRAIDGLPMLIHQAARSFALWTGVRVPAEEFLRGARRAMAAGKRKKIAAAK
ncbi:MAG: shikimate dehydrogenase [Deltaproteobacteria bacterium]|nr:shikimate dehydrogenase [Deltaproteobacteria bacterium]